MNAVKPCKRASNRSLQADAYGLPSPSTNTLIQKLLHGTPSNPTTKTKCKTSRNVRTSHNE